MKKTGATRTLGLALALLMTSSAASSFAQDSAKAEQILQQMASQIQEAQQLSVQSNMMTTMKLMDLEQEQVVTTDVAVKRPNHFAMRAPNDAIGFTVIANEQSTTYAIPAAGLYKEQEAAASISDIQIPPEDIQLNLLSGNQEGLFQFTDLFLSDDPYAAITSDMNSMEYLGEETLDGQPVHRILVDRELMDLEFFIAAGEQPLPLKIVPNIQKLLDQMAENAPNINKMDIAMSIQMTDWNLAPEFEENTFTYTPGDGAKKVDSLQQGLAELSQQAPQPEESSLKGQAPPNFTGELFEGGSVALQDYLGDKVVVLDFWATWCPPCRQAMPMMEELAEEHADKMTVLAINQGEPQTKVQEYLEETGLKPTVVMDPQGEIGNQYGVSGYPTFVIINTQGQIEEVIVGFREDDLRSTISRLVEE